MNSVLHSLRTRSHHFPHQVLVSRSHAVFHVRLKRHIFTSSLGKDASTSLTSRGVIVGGITVIAGVFLYGLHTPSQQSLHTLIESPAIIPSIVKDTPNFAISSPIEPNFLAKLSSMLYNHIFSPLRTGLRFLHLVIIFAPVLITSPMLFIGQPEDQYRGERWGAMWWYDVLTFSMQKAGPTFIKVSAIFIVCPLLYIFLSSHNGQRPVVTSFRMNYVIDLGGSKLLRNHMH